MFFTFEISNPFQWMPGFWRCEGVTSWRIWWGWFAISCHPMRYDEMIDLASSGAFAWHKSRPTQRPPDECHEAVCVHKFASVTNTLEICVLCGIRR